MKLCCTNFSRDEAIQCKWKREQEYQVVASPEPYLSIQVLIETDETILMDFCLPWNADWYE